MRRFVAVLGVVVNELATWLLFGAALVGVLVAVPATFALVLVLFGHEEPSMGLVNVVRLMIAGWVIALSCGWAFNRRMEV